MASACDTGVQLWDLSATREGDKELATLPAGWTAGVRFDPKGESLITNGSEGLRRWPITPDPETGGLRIGPPRSFGPFARAPWPLPVQYADSVFSADGRTGAHSPQPGHVFLFDPEHSRWMLHLESPCLKHAALSPDGRWLATGNWEGRGVKVWDAHTGALDSDLDVGGPEEWAAWPAFSPDSKTLVTGTFGEFCVWEVGSWRKNFSFSRDKAGTSTGGIVFSPDGKMLALLHSMTGVRLVDPATG